MIRQSRSTKRYFGLALACFTLSSCVVGPKYQRPAVAALPQFANPNLSQAAATSKQSTIDQTRAPELLWWQVFHDAELDSLVQRAVSANLDLEQASDRVAQARASASAARSQLAPDVSLSAAAKRNRSRFFTGVSAGGQPALRAVEYSDYQANFDARWELDLWGRIRNGARAARFDLDAEQQDRRDVLVTLLSEIARNYTELRGSQLRLAIAAKNQSQEREIVNLTQVLANAGLATERDVAQARAALASLDATIPMLEASILVSLHRIGVLTGGEPEALGAELTPAGPLPAGPACIATGLPSQLLERRPDIRRAEAELLAANARIGVAKADYFPRVTLLASAGRDATQLHDLSLGAANIFGAGPSVSLPVFNAGRIQSNVRLARARAQEAAARFRASILTAFEETENALARHKREEARLLDLQEGAAQQKTAFELAEVQYKAGLADFTTVLTAERDLQTAEDQVAQSEVALTTDLIALYKALGGGWTIAPDAPALRR